MEEEIMDKLQEYINLMDFKDEFFQKDYKNNVKFIKWSISKMIKTQIQKSEIVNFIQMAINIHKVSY